MNDFLQSLRGNAQKEKRVPKTRRGYDNGNHYNTAPGFQSHGNYQGGRSGNVKRPATRATSHPSHMPGVEQQPPYLSMDPMDVMVELMDIYTKNQELLINIEERRMMVEERKALALEEIVELIRENPSPEALKQLTGSGLQKERRDETEDEDTGESQVRSRRSQKELFPDKGSDFHDRSMHHEDERYADERDSYGVDMDDEPVSESNLPSEISGNRSFPPRRRDFSPSHLHTSTNGESETADDSEEIHTVLRKRSRVGEVTPKTVRRSNRRAGDPGAQPVQVIKRKKPDEASSSERRGNPSAGHSAPSAGASSMNQGLLSRDEVMDIIESMRDQGATYDQVAQHLVDLGQPTFSGRGEWHAQTIHRLCSRKGHK